MGQTYKRKYHYYSILGLDKSASFEEINKAYRQLIPKYHPDISKEPGALATAKKINIAYGVISNPKEKFLYDNSEAECPKCWTHEVKRINEGQPTDMPTWQCRHCGYRFTFVIRQKSSSITEAAPAKKSFWGYFLDPVNYVFLKICFINIKLSLAMELFGVKLGTFYVNRFRS